MLTAEEKASATNLALFLETKEYNKYLMKNLFIALSEKTPEHRYDVLEFWKNTNEMTQRLFLEICTYLHAPKVEAITFTV